MTDKLHLFNTTDAQRIAKVVKQVEGQSRNVPQLPKRDPIPTGSEGFWAKITGRDFATGAYAWKKLRPKSDGTWEDDPDNLTGTTSVSYALEDSGYIFVQNNEVVWLRSRHSYYIFEYEDQTCPGVCDVDISSGGTGAVSVYFNTTDTTQNVTAKNILADLSTNDKVFVTRINGIWFVTASAPGSDQDKIIKITGGSSGQMVSPNGNCVWGGVLLTMPAEIATLCSNGWVEGANVWVFAMDGVGGVRGDGSENTVTTPQLFSGDRFHARRVGTFSYGGDARDLYVIRSNLPASARFIEFAVSGTFAKTNASISASVIQYWNGPNPGGTVTVYNLTDSTGNYVFSGPNSGRGYAVYNEIENKYYIFTMKQTGTDLDEVILIDNSTPGLMLDVNGGCVWSGTIQTLGTFSDLCGDPYVNVSSVWVFAIDSAKNDGSASDAPALKSGDRYIGHKVGTYTFGGSARDLYAVRSGLARFARTIFFTLDADMEKGDFSQDAQVWWYMDGPNPDPSISGITVYNQDGLFCGLQDAVGIAVWNDIDEVYMITHMHPPALIIEGTLSSALSSTSVSTAVTHYYQGTDPGSTITVYDDQEFFKGAASGSKFRAIYDDEDEKYRLINVKMSHGVRFYKATLSSAMTSANSTGSISGGLVSLTKEAAPSGVTSAANTYALAGASGDAVLIYEDISSSPTYHISQVTHHEYNMVRDVYMSSNDLKKDKRKMVVMTNETSDTSTTIITGTECP